MLTLPQRETDRGNSARYMNRHVEPPQRFDSDPGSAPRASGGATGRRADVAFRAARRNSRLVRFLRWALPAGVVVGLGLSFAIAYLEPLRLAMDLPFDLGRVSFNGRKIKMEFPQLQGFTSDNRGYSVSAESASQDLTNTNRVELEKIEARMELADKGWATLSARTGAYDTKTEMLNLGGGVNLDTDTGYAGRLQGASIDVKGGKIVSDQPVELLSRDGKLTADRMEISQKDSRAVFTGNVRVDFKMPASDEEVAKPPKLRGSTNTTP